MLLASTSFPESVLTVSNGYSQSITNLKQVSLQSDNVFGDDGGVHELGTMSGTIQQGLTVDLAVPVKSA